jgi:hypothetical protein
VLEAWECCQAKVYSKVTLGGWSIQAAIGTTMSHSVFLSGNMDDDSHCKVGVINFPNDKTMGGQTAHVLYEIILREKFAKMNKLTGTFTLSSGIQTRVADKSLAGSLDGTVA